MRPATRNAHAPGSPSRCARSLSSVEPCSSRYAGRTCRPRRARLARRVRVRACRCRSTRSSAASFPTMSPASTLVHLRQRVVQAFPVAERFVQWRVEAVQEAQLELVRALEQVLQLRKRERDLSAFSAGLRLGRGASAVRQCLGSRTTAGSHSGRRTPTASCRAVRARRERHEQVLLRACDCDVEQPRLVLDRAAVAVGIGDRGLRDDVEEAEAAVPLGRETVLRRQGMKTAGHCIPWPGCTVVSVTASGVAYPTSASDSA